MAGSDPVRVMVVDDQADARFLVRAILGEHADLDVVAEADGADSALRALDSARPQVALLDARMPRVDGFELAPLLLERAPELRIALLTSIVDHVVEAQAREAGVHRCASKGDFEALPALVRELAGGSAGTPSP